MTQWPSMHDPYPQVSGTGHVVQHNEQHVKPRQQGVRQVDVLVRAHGQVIVAKQGVGRCHHRAAGIQLRLDACFGNGHCLLLHHLQGIHVAFQ